MENNLERYSIIEFKNKREIVLLIGSGCSWKKCTFCDYHLDYNKDEDACFKLNKTELNKITGIYKKLEVINSGSFTELDKKTIAKIKEICLNKDITQVHFEAHWSKRGEISKLKNEFRNLGIKVKLKIGVETFDYDFRENYLVKGIEEKSPENIAKYFNEVCLLQGLSGQTVVSMKNDIEIGLKYFERVCVNIMQNNNTKIKQDPSVVNLFLENIYPIYKDENRIDILLNNIDFGVGGKKT